MIKTNPVPELLLGLPGPINDNEAGIGDIIIESYQSRTIFESSEAPRVMQESFEFIVVNVVFKLSQETSDEVADEDHFCLECAQNGEKNGLYCSDGYESRLDNVVG